jgi:hypothetical protein
LADIIVRRIPLDFVLSRVNNADLRSFKSSILTARSGQRVAYSG